MATRGAIAVALALAVCALSAVPAEVQFQAVELGTHRLPTNVRPLHYHLDLDFNWRQGYTGKVRIVVEFTGPTSTNKVSRCLNKLTNHVLSGLGQSKKCEARLAEKNRIVLHKDKSVRLDSVRVFKVSSKDADKLKELKIKSLGEDQQKQLITLDMSSELPPAGSHGVLELTFGGQFRTDKTGIYQSKVRVNGEDYVHVAAKFQPTFARLALPCFDEPGYKAKFSLAIKHVDKHQAYATTDLLSQEAIGTTKSVVISKFKETPKMSIHMVAFTVGQFDEPLEVQMRDNLRLRAITPVHRRQSGAYVLEVAKFALQWFEKFIGFEFPLEKLDIVAFSDMDTDNTETWGLTFVKDIYALVDDETKPDSRITTAVNVAHVVVHQWFANLITAEWWDDMWITESVAAQMAFEIVADLFPEQSPYFVRISTLSGVLTADSSGKNHSLSPTESELSTSSKVYELFDNIQFMKSGALARLQQDTLGREEFRKVLQKIVRQHAYGNVEFGDLMSAISESPASAHAPMKGILSSWKSLKSYPVIDVSLNEDRNWVTLYEQRRPSAKGTLVDHTDPPLRDPWVLPLKVLFSDVLGENQVTKDVILGVDFSQQVIDLPDWFLVGRDFVKVSPNPSLATYYRVRYSDELLQPLKEPIEQKMLATMDRLHLLDDSRALAAGSLIAPDTFKQLLGWHATETEAAMIIEMLLAAQTLGTLKTTESSPSPALQVFMKLFERDGFRVTGAETLLEQRARMVTLNSLITKQVKEVIDAGVKAFDESNGQVALFLREPVYAAVVAAGSEEQVNQMLEHLKRTESHEEQIRLANALSVYTRGLDILNDLGRWLETCDLKESEKASIQAKLSNSLVEAVKGQEASQ